MHIPQMALATVCTRIRSLRTCMVGLEYPQRPSVYHSCISYHRKWYITKN